MAKHFKRVSFPFSKTSLEERNTFLSSLRNMGVYSFVVAKAYGFCVVCPFVDCYDVDKIDKLYYSIYRNE